MDKAEINTPDEDVDIGYEFTGHIRCRHLTILEGGSVLGTAVAHRIDVKGILNGVADCEYFQALPPAVVRGTVFAPKYHTRDRDDREADVAVLHVSTRQQIFREATRPAVPGLDEVINDAIDEAVAERLSASDAGVSTSPSEGLPESFETPTSLGDIEMSLSERLASRGLISLVPAMAEPSPPAAPVDCEPPRPIQTARMPLPSLV